MCPPPIFEPLHLTQNQRDITEGGFLVKGMNTGRGKGLETKQATSLSLYTSYVFINVSTKFSKRSEDSQKNKINKTCSVFNCHHYISTLTVGRPTKLTQSDRCVYR